MLEMRLNTNVFDTIMKIMLCHLMLKYDFRHMASSAPANVPRNLQVQFSQTLLSIAG